jgi:hypothetical protein
LKDDLKNVSAQLQENSFRTGNKSSSATGNASADSEQLQKILYQQVPFFTRDYQTQNSLEEGVKQPKLKPYTRNLMSQRAQCHSTLIGFLRILK